MKRILLISLVAAMVIAVGAAPAMAEGKIGFGGKAGLSIAKLTGDDADGLDSRLGFAVGVYIDVPLTTNLSFHPEALYVQKGAKEDVEVEEDVTIEATYKFDYIEFPLLLMMRFPTQTGSVTPKLFAGPSVAFKMSSKIKGEYEGQSYEEDIDDLKSLDLGVTVGGGVAFKIGEKNQLTLDARYTLGVTKIVDTDGGDDVNIKNGNIAILVGFGI